MTALRQSLVALRRVWPTVLVMLWLVLAPTYAYTGLRIHDEQRVGEILLLAAGSVAVLVSARRRDDVVVGLTGLGRWRWAASLVVLSGLVATAGAVAPMLALRELALVCGVTLLALVIAGDVRTDPRLALTVVVVAAAVALGYYFADLLTLPRLDDNGYGLWARGRSGGFIHPRHFNHYVVALLPLAAVLCFARTVPRWVRALVLVLVTVGWWALFLTEARGAVLALSAATLLVAVRYRAARRFTAVLAGTGVVGVLASITTRSLLSYGSAVIGGDVLSSSGRIDEWQDVLGIAVREPLGIGPGHLAHVAWFGTTNRLAHPHSMLVQAFAEWGVLAGAVIVAAGLTLGWALLARPRPAAPDVLGAPGELVRAAVVVTFGSLLLLSLVSGVLVMPVGNVGIAVAAGAVLGLWTPAGPPVAPPVTAPGRVAAAGLCAVAVLAFLVPAAAGRDEASHGEARAAFLEQFSGVNRPRFWLQGIEGLDSAAHSQDTR